MRNDKTYLAHIREAIKSIEEYLKGINYDGFVANKMIIDAVVREMEIIGEASNNLSEEFRESYPDIVWRRMKDMRNFPYLRVLLTGCLMSKYALPNAAIPTQ
jgi:uncharacterized protein with HEPN domain